MRHLEYFFRAKYHYSIVQRLQDKYEEFKDKRIVVGIINESAKATSSIIKAYLSATNMLSKNFSKNVENFKKITSSCLTYNIQNDLFRILEVEKARKVSPVEYQKEESLILLIGREYKILTIDRLKELMKSLEIAILCFNNEQKYAQNI
jgi:hypothetical protein